MDTLTNTQLEIIEEALSGLLDQIDQELIDMEDDLYEGYFVSDYDFDETVRHANTVEGVLFDVQDELDARWEDLYYEDTYFFGQDDEYDIWGLDEIEDWEDELVEDKEDADVLA